MTHRPGTSVRWWRMLSLGLLVLVAAVRGDRATLALSASSAPTR